MSKKIAYMYEPEKSSYFFSNHHPMEPQRVNMTHELVQSYNLFSKMEIMRFDSATEESLRKICTEDYLNYLKNTTPATCLTYDTRKKTYNTDEDCPVFKGVYDYMASSVGGSLACASRINQGKNEICIHWAGGMHHAKQTSASGFCYGNDIVACILDLLRHHKRVMYIDVDVHHGDGVEHAFYATNRVLSMSFHQYGDFFPGTGCTQDIGIGPGEGYAINVPLKRGIDDVTYQNMFRPIVYKAIEKYQPEVIVMQMGADSVVGDRLGQFNLSNTGHASCLDYVMKFNIPMVVLGGGGYTAQNVARTWCLETGTIVGQPLSNTLPPNSCIGALDNKGQLKILAIEMDNLNSKEYLEKTMIRVMELIDKLESSPSVQLQQVPTDWHVRDQDLDQEDQDNYPDTRVTQRHKDKYIHHTSEYYDGEDNGNDREGEGDIKRRYRENGHTNGRERVVLTAEELDELDQLNNDVATQNQTQSKTGTQVDSQYLSESEVPPLRDYSNEPQPNEKETLTEKNGFSPLNPATPNGEKVVNSAQNITERREETRTALPVRARTASQSGNGSKREPNHSNPTDFTPPKRIRLRRKSSNLP